MQSLMGIHPLGDVYEVNLLLTGTLTGQKPSLSGEEGMGAFSGSLSPYPHPQESKPEKAQ